MADPSPLNAAAIWQAALDQLAGTSTDALFQALQAMAQLKAIDSDKVTIALPYEYLREVFGRDERARLSEVFSALLQTPMQVEFVVEQAPEAQFNDFARRKRDAISQRKQTLLPSQEGVNGAPPAPLPGVNPHLTFGAFVEDEANRLALAAAMTAATDPGRMYNPLYLFGTTGLGKSHLLHGIANAWLARGGQGSVQVVSAEDYANEHIESIRTRDTQRVRDRQLQQSLLLIDDLQFLMNKPNCQEGFTHLLKSFLDSGRQVVLTADRRPRDLVSFPEHLISRLEGGLLAELGRPTLPGRMRMLQAKAHDWKLDVAPSTLELIATRLPGNVRSLEGCLRMLQAQQGLRGGAPLPADDIEKLIQGFLSTASSSRRSVHHDINTIMEVVCQHYRVSPADMLGRGRTNAVVHPRHIVMFFARELTNMSLAEIGRAMGNRDHSTVSYAIERFQGRATMEKTLQRELEFVRRLLLGEEVPDSK